MNSPYSLRAAKAAAEKVQIRTPKGDEPFNMPSFGGYNKSGSAKVSATEKMFDDQGTLNAGSKVDALQKIAHIINTVADSGEKPQIGLTAGSYGAGSVQSNMGMSDHELIAALQDPTGEGFAIVGQELLNPIKEVIDYEGWIRKILAVRPVKQGEVVRYDKDVFVVAWVIGADGQTPESRVGGRFVYPPEFEITALPTIEIRHIYQAQYDILARTQDRSRQSIEFQEDRAGKELLDRAAQTTNTPVAFATLNLAALEAIRYQVERHRLVLDKFLINRQEVSDLVTVLSQEVDPVTQRELIMAGYIGSILNAMIITSAGTNTFEVVEPGEVYGVTTPEYLGGMPIRVELFSEPVTQFLEGKATRGWFWYELISQVVINPKGVSKGVKV